MPRPDLGAGPDDEALVQLGQDDVVAAADLGPGAHRGAEAGCAGGRALDRHDDGRGAARGVVVVGVRTAEEHAVLDAERGELARPDAEERELRGVGLVAD